MTCDLLNLDPFADHIASRFRILPFDDGPHLHGVIVCGLAVDHLKVNRLYGTAFFATDGVPQVAEIFALPCEDLDAIDPKALALSLPTTGLHDFEHKTTRTYSLAGTMPRQIMKGHPAPDLFASMRCGVTHEDNHLIHLVMTNTTIPVRELDEESAAAAHAMAAQLLTPRLDLALEAFRSTLSPRNKEILGFMRSRLPIYDARVMRVLCQDPHGHAREFASRYPLLAMRSLSDPEVAAYATAGEHARAVEASQREELVGRWVLRHWLRHPKSANAVDGTRRGEDVDFAVDCFRFVSRDHLPMSPGEFAASVAVCLWANDLRAEYEFDDYGVNLAGNLARTRGKWAATVASVSRIAGDLVKDDFRRTLLNASWETTASFRDDLLIPAITLARGPYGLMRCQEALDQFKRGHINVIIRGMGIPDQVRMLGGYREAKPTVAGIDSRHDVRRTVSGHLRDMPWLSLGETEVLPVRVEASNWGYDPTLPSVVPGALAYSIRVVAPSLNGKVTVHLLVRRSDGTPASKLVTRFTGSADALDTCWRPETHHVINVLQKHTGAGEEPELGRRLIKAAGLDEPIRLLVEDSRPACEARLAEMLTAWRGALPRRFRGLDVAAFAETLAAEFEGTLSAEATPVACPKVAA